MDIPKQWTFENAGVAAEFDKHVREQLPWYEIATAGVRTIARQYIPQGGLVYDIGAATGNIGRTIAGVMEQRGARLIAIESSREMADKYTGPGELVVCKAEEVDLQPFDLAVCFLVLIFMPPANVPQFLDKLRQKCRHGGAIIIVERMLPSLAYASIVSARLTLTAKHDAGVPLAEIMEKELSLSGVQRPIDARIIEQRQGWEWFRFGDFAGWIIEPSTRPRGYE